MADVTGVVVQGLGVIGLKTAGLVLKDPGLSLVGVADIDEKYAGKDLGELLGDGEKGVKVSGDAKALFRQAKPDVVVIATSSFWRNVEPQMRDVFEHNAHAVASSEEVFYPGSGNLASASELSDFAYEKGLVGVGTGIDPGLMLDTLPVKIYRALKEEKEFDELNTLRACRVRDTSTSRKKLQLKTGAGLSTKEFYEGVEQGTVGHVGMPDSGAYCGDNIFGHDNYGINFSREPVIATKDITTNCGIKVKKGDVAGLHESCEASDGSREIILELWMFAGAADENTIEIYGRKNSGKYYGKDSRRYYRKFDFSNIKKGDDATAEILCYAAKKIKELEPGLRVMELPDPNDFLAK